MDKKRLGRSSAKAQITIFIILGLLLLAVFLFLFYLVSTLAKSQLMGERERLQLHAFQKEALRIYLDDCLSDELEMGLLLLGKQGRLWDDQPGGRKFFDEGRTGLMLNPQEQVAGYHSGRVAYAITNESSHYFQHFNAYPCNNESFFSQFCQYTYPDTTIGFGLLPLRSSTVEGDLQRFMENRTLHCLSQWLHLNISQQAVLQREEVELKLRVHDEGIGVTARYPLRFTIGRQEFFHLANFDFFYPTEFKRLLDVAALSPLQWDQKFIDFNYTLATLQQPTFQYSSLLDLGDCTSSDNYFLCRRSLQADLYQLLSLQMRNYSTPWGDDVFEFTAPVNTIIRNQPYTLRIARQNRPPALDYLQRSPCLEPEQENYDYFVVKEHPDYGDINLTATALDPDEDVVRYGFSASPEVSSAKAPGYPENNLYVAKDNDALLALTKGLHYITVAAYDGHQSTDEQMVRIFVDRNVDTALTLESPYLGIDYGLGQGRYIVSREDPVFMKITVPLLSADPNAASLEKVDFVYDDQQGETTTFKLPDRRTLPDQQEFCYNLPVNLQPQTAAHCLLSDYGQNELDLLNPGLPASSLLHPFRQVTLPDNPGKLTLGYGVDYCGNIHLEDKTEVEVTVAECVPYRDPTHPFAYPYQNYQFSNYDFAVQAGTFQAKGPDPDDPAGLNPFLGTHSCCLGVPDNPAGWSVADDTQPCFIEPEWGCYGQDDKRPGLEWVRGNYVLETKKRFCDGQRGNMCVGNFVYELVGQKLTCGTNYDYLLDPGNPGCAGIADKCQGNLAFGLIEDVGWCHGKMGCAELCPAGVVYIGDDPQRDSYSGLLLNNYAKENKVTDDSGFSSEFQCGCLPEEDDGKKCDNDYGGLLDDVCDNGECKDLACSPGATICDKNDPNHIDRKVCNSAGTEWIGGSSCPGNTVCNEGVCVDKICTPHKLDCFSTMDQVVREYYDQKVAEAKEGDTFDVNLLVFACNSIGSEYEIVAECAPLCDPDGTAIVDVNNVGFDEMAKKPDNAYKCGCTEEDTQAPNRQAKSCKLMDGTEGKCVKENGPIFCKP